MEFASCCLPWDGGFRVWGLGFRSTRTTRDKLRLSFQQLPYAPLSRGLGFGLLRLEVSIFRIQGYVFLLLDGLRILGLWVWDSAI